MRLLFALLVFLVALPVGAQTPADSSQVADSSRTADPARSPLPFGRAVTYGALLQEYRQLRRRPPQNGEDSLSAPDPYLGIQGLVVDETATPSGRYFYEVYFQSWAPPPGSERVTVNVSEQPLPGTGTAILIKADGELLLQTRLPRRPEEIEELAIQAVRYIQTRLSGG